jgi:hypothetical protein
MPDGALTVGALRALLAEIPDDVPVRLPGGPALYVRSETLGSVPFVVIGGGNPSALRLDPAIDRGDANEVTADNGIIRLALLDPESYGGRVFKRRAVKGAGSPQARQVCWIVAELDGVRVYVDGDRVMVTKRELYP